MSRDYVCEPFLGKDRWLKGRFCEEETIGKVTLVDVAADYRTVSGVAGPLVILEKVKVIEQISVSL